MISFRRKKKKIDTFAEIKAKLEKPTEFETKLGETLERGVEKIKTGVDKAILEDLSKKIEEENKSIFRKFNKITRKTKEITLESPEVIELIKLYSNATDKLAEMKKLKKNVEDVCRKAGFTPSNVRTILESPIERLVDSLMKKKIKVKKTKK